MIAAPPATPDLPFVLRAGRASLGGGDAKRFPQPRMAELLGVSLRQYQRWERGDSQPRPRDLERIVATLAGDPRPAAPQEPGRLLEELASLRRQVNALRGELDSLRSALAALVV